MQRIATAGAVDGLFSEGDPDIGILPTTFSPEWCNAIQEEIATVVEDPDGGDDTLDVGDNGQLLAAIQTMIASATAASRVPVGSVVALAGNAAACPAGWLVTDGAAKSRTTFADLWAYAQVSGILAADGADKIAHPGKFGLGDGVNTFELPKLEHYISGLKAGRTPGTHEEDQMQRIQGKIGRVLSNNANSPPGTFEADGPFSTSTVNGQYSAAGENVALVSIDTGSAAAVTAGLRAGTTTRPINTSYPFIIKI